MSIVHPQTTEELLQTWPASRIASARRAAVVWLRLPLWLCLLLSLIAHVWLIYHAQGLVDGDEAQIGVQALRILHGERPVYFYGQPYMGSLVAYLLAPLFALVGPTAWALRAESLGFSLLLVYLTWRLAGALADRAQLSGSMRLRLQTMAALVAALPPLYDGVVEMRVWGGYIETFVFSLWLLYSVVRLSQRWWLGIGLGETWLRWLGIGLLVGIGLWVDPLIELPLAVCILWMVGVSFVALMTAPQNGSTRLKMLHTLVRNWSASIAAVPAALLGFAPGLYWGYQHQWENVEYILHPGNNVIAYDPYIAAVYPTHLDRIRGVTVNYLTCDVPRALSGLTPNVPQQRVSALAQLYHPHSPVILAYDVTLAIMLVCVGGAAVLFLLSYVFKNVGFVRQLLTLPLLFATMVSGAFCLSDLTARYLVHHTCDADKTGRYASLLVLVLPFLVAGVLTVISMGGEWASSKQRDGSSKRRASPRKGQYRSNTVGTGSAQGTRIGVKRIGVKRIGVKRIGVKRIGVKPIPTDEGSEHPKMCRRWPWAISPLASARLARAKLVPRTNLVPLIIVKGMLLVMLVLYLSTQSGAYARVAQDGYFRSPFCKISLTHTDQVQHYLREQQIHYLWSDIWIGNVLMFRTATDVISTDPRVFTGQLKDRIPEYSNAIRGAKHASVAFFAFPDDRLLEQLKTLDTAHIKYQTARFTVDQGVDLVILTPVDYTFPPSEAAMLVIGGPKC